MATTEEKNTSTQEKRIPKKVHRLTMTLHFEHGLAAGNGAFGNEMLLARNGQNKLVLRGTAIAGVLRSAWRENYGDNDKEYFGNVCGDTGISSLVVTSDCVIATKQSHEMRRTHHLRCRHRGSVLKGGLYSMEIVPPNTEITMTLWFNETTQTCCGYDFFQKLAGLAEQGLIFGGSSNRGIGLAIGSNFQYGVYDFSQSENKATEYARYLKDHYQWRMNSKSSEGTTSDVSFVPEKPAKWHEKNLKVKFSLTIPRGQDLLVSQGSSESGDAEPHRVKGADGKDYWLIPGSTLHGLFRDWVSRLAAREDKVIADSYENFTKHSDRTGEDIGWLFIGQEKKKGDETEQEKREREKRQTQARKDFRKQNGFVCNKNMLEEDNCNEQARKQFRNDYPVDHLFGSLYRSGRVHISDAIVPVTNSEQSTDELARVKDSEVQKRVHVAIDAISGGAIEHLLFENYVLVGNAKKPVFHFTMIVWDIDEKEAKWLVKTLRAIDIGLLRIGSSKSCGRLELVEGSIKAEGHLAEKFTSLHLFNHHQ